MQTSDITVVSPNIWSFVTGRHWQAVLFEGAIWCTVCYHVVFVTAYEGGVTDKHKGMQSSRRVIHQCIRLVPAIISANIVCGCGEVEMNSVLFLLQYKCTLCKEISQNKVTDTPSLRTVLWLWMYKPTWVADGAHQTTYSPLAFRYLSYREKTKIQNMPYRQL